jgi:uncharacterized protein YjbI with pentapeptide repeats
VPTEITLSNEARLKSQNDVRSALLQGVAGLVLLGGAAATWRQIQINREGQITERFTRAVEHIGNDKLDVRLGGIYALERIAKNSEADRGAIMEILTAYIRGHSPAFGRTTEYWSSRATKSQEVPELVEIQPTLLARIRRNARLAAWRNMIMRPRAWIRRLRSNREELLDQTLRGRSPDVQAALVVLGRRETSPDMDLDLSGIDLHGADLSDRKYDQCNFSLSNLDNADLSESSLQSSVLLGASLKSANLQRVDLRSSWLFAADLQAANLEAADLSVRQFFGKLERLALGFEPSISVRLNFANLKKANLNSAKLQGAILANADLSLASLKGSDLRNADLTESILTGARADKETKWPNGFDWRNAGVVLEE